MSGGIFFSLKANWIGHYLLEWTNEEYPNSGNVWDSGWPFCRWNCGVPSRRAKWGQQGKQILSLRLSLFFGPTALVVSTVGRLTENGDKINPKECWDRIRLDLRRCSKETPESSSGAEIRNGSVVDVHVRTGLMGRDGLGWPCSRNLRHCNGCSADTELLHIHDAAHRARRGPRSGMAWLSLPRQRELDCFQGYGDIRIIWFPRQWPLGEQGKGLRIWLHRCRRFQTAVALQRELFPSRMVLYIFSFRPFQISAQLFMQTQNNIKLYLL